MIDISLHLLDLMQNSAHAKASRVSVLIEDDPEKDDLSVTVKDDGKGMSVEERRLAMDPFYSTGGKKTGLGLPLALQAAQAAGGKVAVSSEVGRGTEVRVSFRKSHIDRQPIGDPVSSVVAFLAGNGTISVTFEYRGPDAGFRLDSDDELTDEGGRPKGQIAFLWSVEEKLRDGLAAAGFRPD